MSNIIVFFHRPNYTLPMKRLQAFKFELQPTGDQSRDMLRFAGTCRFIYNKALALQKENYEGGNKFINYVVMAKLLTAWRNSLETPWLKEAPCHSLQHSLKNLDKAFKNFFAKRAKFPRFKRKYRGDSFRYPDSQQIKLDQVNSRICLPKLGWVRYRKSREVLGEIRNATLSYSSGKWFLSIQTQREVEEPKMQATTAIGVDLGITHLATLSNSTHIAPLNSFKTHQKRLARYQRKMSHKKKFSKNWKKAKCKVQKIHTGISNARKDFLHKTTTAISKNHAIVCIEDLQVGNMSKSAVGTREEPGKGVQKKARRNRCILDQGWYMFRSQLEYKMKWAGGTLVVVPAYNTSRTCPNPDCGYISAENRKTQSKFRCLNCGYENNADVVGAINTLERGLRLLACGESVKLNRSMKQEPTEASQLAFS
jgi:putative transposase